MSTRRNARLEDLMFLVDTGETTEGAARRLGCTIDTLQRWCYRHAPDLWRTLAARDAA